GAGWPRCAWAAVRPWRWRWRWAPRPHPWECTVCIPIPSPPARRGNRFSPSLLAGKGPGDGVFSQKNKQRAAGYRRPAAACGVERKLLDLDLGAFGLELLLRVLGGLFRHTLEHGARRGLDEVLGFLQAEVEIGRAS